MPADCWAGKAASAKFKKSGTVEIVNTRSRNNTYAMITLQIGRGHKMVPCQSKYMSLKKKEMFLKHFFVVLGRELGQSSYIFHTT